ncbi:hypothetical protein MCOR27_005897 [Pyricularia oryzae]|uniref:PLAC8-domain-containing protein n=1 Tax=Pyricularia grisea TaxID=148305 RepID=A0ABQ8NFV4_PYRGI|nr:hypothetical protein MCOR01_003733 [Pyricularia oryzae]KAI6296410.1 hypothetical protein MCOR33_006962 [Pyricularia grisea]KAI6262344.1 hypothetical protein MCOR19_001384 [Pyricularia oryzae]KAI6273604.1 hypothetical protein MCOR26_006849 [Pyricularia oryzae]KAI6277778.1 hypothetical protein MCOR27_005897 [Pyricularia oryzae]
MSTSTPPRAPMPPVPSTTVTVTATGPSQEQRQGGKLQDLLQGPDAQQWQARFNTTMADVGGVVNSKAPESAEPFSENLFGCFGDIGLCLQGCLIPCVVFGKTHHRTRKNARMEGYQPVNTTCLLLCGLGCVGLSWIPMSMQRADIRRKYGLRGSCLGDIALACCCGCCAILQEERESAHREPLDDTHTTTVAGDKTQYNSQPGMNYPTPPQ